MVSKYPLAAAPLINSSIHLKYFGKFYRFNYSIKIFEIIRIEHLITINRNTLTCINKYIMNKYILTLKLKLYI